MICVGNNFCGCFTQSYLINSGERAGWRLEESLYQETRYHDYTTTSIGLPPSFFTNKISGRKEK